MEPQSLELQKTTTNEEQIIPQVVISSSESASSSPTIEGEISHTPQGSIGEYSTDLGNPHQHRATLYEPLTSGALHRSSSFSKRRQNSHSNFNNLPVDAALRKHLILKYKVNQDEDEEGVMYKFLVTQYSPASISKVSSIDSDTSENSSPTSLNECIPQEPGYSSDGQENNFRNKRETVFEPMPGSLSSSVNSNLEIIPQRKTAKAVQHPVSNHVQDVISSSLPPPLSIPPIQPTSTMNNNMLISKLKNQYPHVDITSKAMYKILDFMNDIESSLLEQAVQFAMETQKTNQSENQDAKVTISSQDVMQSILVMLGVTALELSPPKSEIISSYFDTIDQLMLDFENLLYANDWITMKEKKGVEMARRIMPKSDLNCIKGSALIAASAEAIKNAIFSPKLLQAIDPLLISGELIEVLDKQTHVLYLLYGATFCVLRQKRDFVLLYHWYRRKDGTIIVIGRSVEHKDKPLSKDYIRGEILESGYVITPQQGQPNMCQVTYIAHIDIKGTLPEYLRAKFSNIIQETQPLNLLRLRKLLTGKETI